MRWPRDGRPAPDSGPPLLDRIDALRRGASEPEWEVPDWFGWLCLTIGALFVLMVVAGWWIAR